MLTESIAVPSRHTAPVVAQPALIPGNLGYIVGPFTGAATTTVLGLTDWEDEEAVARILPNSFMVGIHLQGRWATIWFQMKDLSLVEKRVEVDDDLQEKLRMAMTDHPELFTFPNV